jgi:hypothetical protein
MIVHKTPGIHPKLAATPCALQVYQAWGLIILPRLILGGRLSHFDSKVHRYSYSVQLSCLIRTKVRHSTITNAMILHVRVALSQGK